MPKIHFEKGEFLTDLQNPKSFAIYGGEKVDSPSNGDGSDYYSLICYYNPSHPIKLDSNQWDVVSVFGADTEASKCTYAISESNAFWWRRCNENEKTKALKYLAETQNLAWEEKDLKLRKLAPGEKLCFDAPPTNSRITGTNKAPTTHRTNRSKNSIVNVSRLAPPNSYQQTKKISGDMSRFNESMVAAIEQVNEEESTTTYYQSDLGFGGVGGASIVFNCFGGRSYRDDRHQFNQSDWGWYD